METFLGRVSALPYSFWLSLGLQLPGTRLNAWQQYSIVVEKRAWVTMPLPAPHSLCQLGCVTSPFHVLGPVNRDIGLTSDSDPCLPGASESVGRGRVAVNRLNCCG